MAGRNRKEPRGADDLPVAWANVARCYMRDRPGQGPGVGRSGVLRGWICCLAPAVRLAVPHTQIDGTYTPLPLAAKNASAPLRTAVTELARLLAAHTGDTSLD